MRSVLALSLLITLCGSAEAATRHRFKPPASRICAGQPVTVPDGIAVPGWTEEETRRWLNSASGPKG
jgi:hypothetical protein